MKKGISKVVISRMPRYYRYLGELLAKGTERISSGELSKLMNVTASQIRQDFNNFGGFGQQGYGYNVQYLYDEIGKILGVDKPHTILVVGAGNMGLALATHSTFYKQGFVVNGIFDINPELKGKKVKELEIRMLDELEEFILHHQVDIVALTIPKEASQDITDRVVKCGVKAIWNFAHQDLDVPNDVCVQNVHLSDSLMALSLMMLQKNQ